MTTVIKDLEGDDWETRHESCVSMFLNGFCHEFAIAFHRGTGLPLYGLVVDSTVWHAFVKCGDSVCFDARGGVVEEKIGEPFGVKPPYNLRAFTETSLRESVREINERAIEKAAIEIEILWPNVPTANTLRKRMGEFVVELEELCRRHGIWIRPSLPSTLPLLTFAVGDEAGYTIGPVVNGSDFVIDRRLE